MDHSNLMFAEQQSLDCDYTARFDHESPLNGLDAQIVSQDFVQSVVLGIVAKDMVWFVPVYVRIGTPASDFIKAR